MGQPEKKVENEILEFLRAKGIYCWKNQSVGIWDPKKRIYRKNRNKYHINGVADILGILPGGRFLAVEVKSRYGKPTDDQKEYLAQIESNGGLALIAKSIDDLAAIFEPLEG